MSDLRPYVCTARECDHSTESFPSIYKYLTHEVEAHELSAFEWSLALMVRIRREESITCVFCGERTDAGKGDNSRGRHVGRHMEEIAFTVVPKAYEEWEFYSESSSANSHPSEGAKTPVTQLNVTLADTDERIAGKVGVTSGEAIAKDAQKYGISAGYSLEHWDPEEKPIVLFDSVFDAFSLGRWIYDCKVFCHGACGLAGELRLLLMHLAVKTKKMEDTDLGLMNADDKALIDSAKRIWKRLKRLLKACMEPLKADCENQLGKENGREFVDTMFGRDRELEATEALMRRMRIWSVVFEMNCINQLGDEEKAKLGVNSKVLEDSRASLILAI